MLVTTAKSGIRISRPRSFAGLMNVYESNYLRLRRIVADVVNLPAIARSVVSDDAPLEMRVQERAPYTTIASLTYQFFDESGMETEPDLVVRIYHDAHLLEAESCKDLPRHPVLRNLKIDAVGEFSRRWQRNMLLHKWLEYCAERGHFLQPN